MDKKVRLTNLTKSSGWAGKIGPDVLTQVLCLLPKAKKDENLLVGIETSDDAAVYKIDDKTAVIQTVDFFTPVVDDPYIYGQIAAVNSLSDIYAMGGKPKLAMNIICFPSCLDSNIVAEILKGGYDKIQEAGALLVGGHTIEDEEPKYGLSVSGFIDPKDVVTNANAKVGDILVLTKPIGSGVMNLAYKGDIIKESEYKLLIKNMLTLNSFARDKMMEVGINSCTDITGFGLLGHMLEMSEGSGVSMKLLSKKVPLLEGALEYANMGLVPAGAYSNEKFIKDKIRIRTNVERELLDVFYDPQTSGGLLISVSREKSDKLLELLKGNETDYNVIGEVIKKESFEIEIV